MPSSTRAGLAAPRRPQQPGDKLKNQGKVGWAKDHGGARIASEQERGQHSSSWYLPITD